MRLFKNVVPYLFFRREISLFHGSGQFLRHYMYRTQSQQRDRQAKHCVRRVRYRECSGNHCKRCSKLADSCDPQDMIRMNIRIGYSNTDTSAGSVLLRQHFRTRVIWTPTLWSVSTDPIFGGHRMQNFAFTRILQILGVLCFSSHRCL